MDKPESKKVKLSVIIPITERFDNITKLFQKYKRGVEATGLSYEFIYVLDGKHSEALSKLTILKKTERLSIISLARWFGEATALNVAFEKATGSIYLTLPAYQQIESDDIPKLVKAIDNSDMVLARRWPRTDSIINRFQARLFNFLLRLSTDLKVKDAGCGVRVIKREVIKEIHMYGDIYRFLPVLAHRQGFRIDQLNVAQAEKDKHQRIYLPGIYFRRLLDLLTIFFLVKFTKKPLRFFGLIGTALSGVGFAITFFLIIERLFFNTTLADSPALFLSSLLVVLGVQIIAIGLIGEIIIFTHAKDLKEYKVDKIIS